MRALWTIWLWLVVASAATAQVRGRTVTFTPVITAAAYAQADQIGVLQKVTGLLGSYGAADLATLVAIDKAGVSHDLTLHFFGKEVTVASADNAAVSVSDAEMVRGYLGSVSIATADYVATAASSHAIKALSYVLATGGGRDAWVLIQCADAGGCDYAAVDDLTFKFVVRE